MILVSMNKFARRWVMYAAAMLAVGGAVIGYWAFDRKLPTTFVKLKETTQDGQVVLLVQTVERSRACDTDVVLRYIESPLGSRLYLEMPNLSKAEMVKMQRESPNEVRLLLFLPIANLAPPGDWIYHVGIEYRCNPIHALWPITDEYQFKFPVK